VSQVYGWLFSSNIPASFSPIMAGLVFDTYHTFTIALFGLAALLVGCTVLVHRKTGIVNLNNRPLHS
jgi:cyanate permease